MSGRLLRLLVLLMATLASGWALGEDGSGQATAASGDLDPSLVTRLQELEKTLTQRLDRLEKKVDALSQRLVDRSRSAAAPEARVPPRGRNVPPELEEITTLAREGKLEEAKRKMEQFQAAHGGTPSAERAKALETELSVVGKEVPPDLPVLKWFGDEPKIDLAGTKPVLLVFWETWCPHCKREMPRLQELYHDFEGRGLQIIGLTRVTKGADEDVSKFVAEYGLTYPIAKEDGDLSRMFQVSGIPAAAVVKGGKVIWRGHPGRISEAMLTNWL